MADSEINRGYVRQFRRWATHRREWSWSALKLRALYGTPTRLLLMPLLPIVAIAVLVRLKIAGRRVDLAAIPDEYREALQHVALFAPQYPLHLYPVVAKSIELAYVRRCLRRPEVRATSVAEVAIGDGVLSAHVFEGKRGVLGLDLSPYSLARAAVRPHVARAIVCDGLNPPLADASMDLLLANNFLHHVTAKQSTLGNWSAVSRHLLFNENTPYWASGWTYPYVLSRLGFRSAAARAARHIEQHNLQCLRPTAELRSLIEERCDVLVQQSFLSERMFFYCSLFSFVLRCFGPPTPPPWRQIGGVLGGIVRPLTSAIARALIVADASADRARDTFVTFLARSRRAERPSEHLLVCPDCRGALDTGPRCARCGRAFTERDGMLFLLPASLMQVEEDYAGVSAARLPDEHL